MIIQLPCGRTAEIDDSDFERTATAYFPKEQQWTGRICDVKWHSLRRNHTNYVAHSVRIDGTTRNVLMHRLILEAAVGDVIDHKNHNGLDNRRENLRICTQLENAQNRKNLTGKMLGVYPAYGRFQAIIKHAGKAIYLGMFDTENEAAIAWNEAAINFRGPNTQLNKVA